MGFVERIASDYAYLTGVLRSLSKISKVAKNPNRTYPQVVRQLAETYGDKVALISERESMTYRGLRPARRPVCALGDGSTVSRRATSSP